MKELAAARPRYGYRRLFTLLRREGWKDGIDRVYRFYCLDGARGTLQSTQEAARRSARAACGGHGSAAALGD